jgi:ubiquinone/menaquinone biosynthesis C-methylase UbiE
MRREPTSHERMSGRPWDASYADGPAPWDTDQPQQAVARLVAAGAFSGEVLDAGCGSGENALLIASAGLSVLGFDVAVTALARARDKAAEGGLAAEFIEADALRLETLDRTFDTVLDSGLLHTFDGAERTAYVASLAAVTDPGATLYVLAFSDEGPDAGPHPLSRKNLESAFTSRAGWAIASLEADRVQTRFHDEHGAPGWLATVTRV